MKAKELSNAMASVLGMNVDELAAGYDAFVNDFFEKKEVVA